MDTQWCLAASLPSLGWSVADRHSCLGSSSSPCWGTRKSSTASYPDGEHLSTCSMPEQRTAFSTVSSPSYDTGTRGVSTSVGNSQTECERCETYLWSFWLVLRKEEPPNPESSRSDSETRRTPSTWAPSQHASEYNRAHTRLVFEIIDAHTIIILPLLLLGATFSDALLIEYTQMSVIRPSLDWAPFFSCCHGNHTLTYTYTCSLVVQMINFQYRCMVTSSHTQFMTPFSA